MSSHPRSFPDAVLMIGFGGPASRAEVQPFLRNLTEGKQIPSERLRLVASHYEEVGGFSPYLKLTLMQAESLRRALEEQNLRAPVYVGMRNWHPTLDDTIRRMVDDGIERALGFVMAPHRSPASWGAYLTAVEAARREARASFQIQYVKPWHDHALFIEAEKERVQEAIRSDQALDWNEAACIFTAHSIPQRMAAASHYASEVATSAFRVAESLAIPHWSVAYQSRSGNPSTPWLEPDVREVIPMLKGLGFRTLVLVPIGFLTDHVEVLYDLDVEARKIAHAQGLRCIRVKTVGDHPRFIEMLAELFLKASHSG